MKFDDTKPKVGRDSTKLEDLIDMLKLEDGKWVTVRLTPTDVLPVHRHWINIIGGKSKKEVKIPKFCIALDTSTDGQLDGVECPYCEVNGGEHFYLQNVIVRDLQENAPRKPKAPSKSEAKSGFKAQGSESWTPIRVVRLPSSLAQKIQGLKELNKVKDKKTGKTTKYSVAHEKYGCDVSIKYDSKQSGTDKYQVQLGDRSKLTEEELGYLQYELVDSLLTKAGREDEKTAKKEIARMEIVGQEKTEDDDDDDGDDEDDSVTLGGKGKKGKGDKKKAKSEKAGKKGKSSKDEDEDDEDEDDEDEDEDDRPSKKSKKSSAKKGKKSRDEDDEDEDDEDDEDEDEDDEDSDDDDSDDDDDDSDDEDEDDEDEDDEDEDDDEDEKPSKKSKKPVKGKGKKSKDEDDEDDEDEDDEDEDDEDDEDEDEDEKPSKKSKKSAKSSKADKKSSKKDKGKKKSKKSKDDDEDDDDIPF